MSELTNQVIAGVAIGLPSAALGYLGYRRATKVDRVTEKIGLQSGHAAEVSLVVAGLNNLVDQLQEDNAALRDEIKYATQRLVTCATESEERASQLRLMRDKYVGGGS